MKRKFVFLLAAVVAAIFFAAPMQAVLTWTGASSATTTVSSLAQINACLSGSAIQSVCSVDPQSGPYVAPAAGYTFNVTGTDVTHEQVRKTLDCNNAVFRGTADGSPGTDWTIALNMTHDWELIFHNCHFDGSTDSGDTIVQVTNVGTDTGRLFFNNVHVGQQTTTPDYDVVLGTGSGTLPPGLVANGGYYESATKAVWYLRGIAGNIGLYLTLNHVSNVADTTTGSVVQVDNLGDMGASFLVPAAEGVSLNGGSATAARVLDAVNSGVVLNLVDPTLVVSSLSRQDTGSQTWVELVGSYLSAKQTPEVLWEAKDATHQTPNIIDLHSTSQVVAFGQGLADEGAATSVGPSVLSAFYYRTNILPASVPLPTHTAAAIAAAGVAQGIYDSGTKDYALQGGVLSRISQIGPHLFAASNMTTYSTGFPQCIDALPGKTLISVNAKSSAATEPFNLSWRSDVNTTISQVYATDQTATTTLTAFSPTTGSAPAGATLLCLDAGGTPGTNGVEVMVR